MNDCIQRQLWTINQNSSCEYYCYSDVSALLTEVEICDLMSVRILFVS